MPLINLVTDLKSLKYGKDTPGGGYSGQPYIQAKIPDGLEPKSPDFILRGGYLTVGDSLTDIKRLTKMFFDLKSPNGVLFIAKQNVLSNSAARTQTSGVINEGIYTPLNTLAQAGVIAFGGHLNKQGINPFAQTGAYAVGDGLYNSVVKSSQPLKENRLAQILKGINENRVTTLEGFKFNEGEVNVLSYKGGPGAPLGVGNTNIRFTNVRTGKASGINFEKFQVGLEGSTTDRTDIPNYILNLSASFAGTGLTIPLSSEGISPFVLNNQLITNVIPEEQWKTYQASYPLYESASFNSPNYFNVIGTAGVSGKYARLTGQSVNNKINDLGQQEGTYNFNVYDPNTTPGNTWPDNSPLIYANNTFTYTQKDIIEGSNVNPPLSDHLSPKTQDFRAVLRRKLGETTEEAKKATALGATPKSLSYDIAQNKTIEYRVNLGDPGARSGKDYSSYTRGVVGPGRTGQPLDKINALQVYSSNTGPITDSSTNDLIAFRIGSINNSNPSIVSYIHFRAFLDSFTDSYTGDWSGMNYLGRGEKFYTYNGFDRKVSLSFTAAAQSKQELIPMYKKLNFLASNLAPDYSGDYGYMKGCFVTLTVGGYLYEQPGFITNLSYDMITEMPWEIGINDTNGAQDPSVKQLSHMIKINSFDFTPIHNFIPQKQSVAADGPTGPEQYIALANPNDGSTNWGLSSVNRNF
jgi:hypothetical protein